MRVFKPVLLVLVVAAIIQSPTSTSAANERQSETVQTELKKLQGLWQNLPGGVEHREGQQVVRLPAADGPCFFIHRNRLLWLDDEGRPTGDELTIDLDVTSDPKRITLTPVADGEDKKPWRQGIYSATGTRLSVHFGLHGGPPPKQFLQFDNPQPGIDGQEWIVTRLQLRAK